MYGIIYGRNFETGLNVIFEARIAEGLPFRRFCSVRILGCVLSRIVRGSASFSVPLPELMVAEASDGLTALALFLYLGGSGKNAS